MQLRKIMKKGAVAALALFAAVAIISCDGPNTSDTADDNKTTEQLDSDGKDDDGKQDPDGSGNNTTEVKLKEAEETKTLQTSGSLTAKPNTGDTSYEMTDSTGGKYVFTFGNSENINSLVRSAAAAAVSGTWKYEKGGKILYKGTFTGESIVALKLTIKEAANPLGEIKSVTEEKNFDLTVNEENGEFQATIPSVIVPLTKINVWSFTDEVPAMVEKYIAKHPDCGFTADFTIISTQNGEYQPGLNEALEKGEVDIYTAEQAFIITYTKGSMEKYAAPYKDFGIDIENKIKAAELAPYTVDIGSNSDGDVVGLGYQTTGGCFIYNRSAAKTVFGSDDPTNVQNEIGGGSGSWDKFWKAAKACGDNGVAIVSGDGDLWRAYAGCADKGWYDSYWNFYIDPKRENFLDASKKLTDNGWSNGTIDWSEDWFKDMKKEGPKPVLGFFGPAWFINYNLASNCGDTYGDWAVCESPVGFNWGGTWILGSKKATEDAAKKAAVKQILEWITLDTSNDGLMYQWATGTFKWSFQKGDVKSAGVKDTVASAVVMKKANGELDLLDGQDMFPYFIKADQAVNSKLFTGMDDDINAIWRVQVRAYAAGEKTRTEAIADFKKIVSDRLGFDIE